MRRPRCSRGRRRRRRRCRVARSHRFRRLRRRRRRRARMRWRARSRARRVRARAGSTASSAEPQRRPCSARSDPLGEASCRASLASRGMHRAATRRFVERISRGYGHVHGSLQTSSVVTRLWRRRRRVRRRNEGTFDRTAFDTIDEQARLRADRRGTCRNASFIRLRRRRAREPAAAGERGRRPVRRARLSRRILRSPDRAVRPRAVSTGAGVRARHAPVRRDDVSDGLALRVARR